MAPALPAKGFPRASLSVDVEDVGVRFGDWFEASRDEGEAVPSLESLFFLEDLLDSLPRESYGEDVSDETSPEEGMQRRDYAPLFG